MYPWLSAWGNPTVFGIGLYDINKKQWILSDTDTDRIGHKTHPGPTLGVHIGVGDSEEERKKEEKCVGRGSESKEQESVDL